MSRLIDEALHVASTGYLQDPVDRMRGAMVALMGAGMLVPAGTAAVVRRGVTLARQHPKRRARPRGGAR